MTLSINGKTYEAGELIAYVEKLENENAELRAIAENQQSSNMSRYFENKKLKEGLAVGSTLNKGLNSLNKALEKENTELKCECRRCVYTDSPCILSDYGKDRNGICDHFKDVFDEIAELKADNDARKFTMAMSEKVEKQLREKNEELKTKVGLSIDCEKAQKNGELCLGYGGDEDEPCERCKNCIKCECGYYQLGETEKDEQLTKAKEIIKLLLWDLRNHSYNPEKDMARAEELLGRNK